jgi:phospholipid/cholesterol/gamma-HCH transport system substrate-binding protein
MSKGRSEFKVGLVVFLAIVMSFSGIIWIKGYKFRQQFNTVKISFPDVGALRTGDPLAVSGVSMGKVKAIDLVSGKVVVTCSIDETVFLGEDATFTIKNVGLMGERFVAVFAGTLSVPLDTSIVHDGRFDTGIPEVMGMMGDMVSEVRELVRLIGSTVASPGTLNDFQRTVSQLHDLSLSLNGLVDESRDDYRRSLHAIERASTSIDEFVQSSAPTADSAIKSFASASAKLDMLTNDLDTLSSSLQMFIDKLNSEEGSLGLLASDQTLYQDVKKAVREVDKLVADIRANPKKYLKMEFKLF